MFLAILMAVLVFGAKAQGDELAPVKWTITLEEGEKPGTAALVCKADIDKTWWLYSQYIQGTGPLPTTITFTDKKKKFKCLGKATEEGEFKEGFDEMFEIDIKKFKDQAVFRQEIKYNPKKGADVNGHVLFMTCDDTQCLPPTEAAFSLKIEGTK